MSEKTLTIQYEEFASLSELTPEDRRLAQAALDALKGSYSPYSHFAVGAALQLADGTVVQGANQENAAYPSGLCAERTAMFYASSRYPDQPFEALAVAASNHGELCCDPATPCGACRQVMAEYQQKSGRPLRILLVGGSRIYKFRSVDDILPFIFDSLKQS